MNFGGKIVILYLSFVALIVGLVVMCFRQDVELVHQDYYGQEMKFQEKIDAVKNAQQLPGSIAHLISKDKVVLSADTSLGSAQFKGSITFFRPSDSKLDRAFDMHFVNHQQTIDRKELSAGVYKLQLSWTSGGKQYFKEDVIYIN